MLLCPRCGRFRSQDRCVLEQDRCVLEKAPSWLVDNQQLAQILPPPSTTRWTAWRKRAVVIGVRQGALTADEAGDRYKLSREELAYWGEAFDRRGIGGLLLKNRSPRRSGMSPLTNPASPPQAQGR